MMSRLVVGCCLLSVVSGQALDRYPPTRQGTFRANVDHFHFGATAEYFDQRYLVYDGFATAEDAPILLYLGNEGAVTTFYNATGAQFEHAKALGGRVVFVEHRYFGESYPSKSYDFLSIEQALEDYALFISALPTLLPCRGKTSTRLCDVILFGGSYGGMIVAWHRQKYPHLSLGAIASGSCTDMWPGEDIQKRFRDAYIDTFETYGRTGCNASIRAALDAAASSTAETLEKAGLQTCANFSGDASDHSKLLFYAEGALASTAMVDYPYPTNFIAPFPANPVRAMCDIFAENANDPLKGLAKAVGLLVNATGQLGCWDLNAELVGKPTRPSSTSNSSVLGGSFQYLVCAELPLQPLTSDSFGFFVPGDGAQTEEIVKSCKDRYNVLTRTEYLSKIYGYGDDLAAGVTNVFFAENSKDPWHVGTWSVPAVVSAGKAGVGVYYKLARGGAHHQDLRFTDDKDPQEVKDLRAVELATVRRWLAGGH